MSEAVLIGVIAFVLQSLLYVFVLFGLRLQPSKQYRANVTGAYLVVVLLSFIFFMKVGPWWAKMQVRTSQQLSF